MKLNNRVALITGAGSGMGEACARLLATQGVKVGLLDRNKQAINKIADEISGLAVIADVTEEASVQAAMDSIIAYFGGLHIVINCAGIAPAARVVGRDGPHDLFEFTKVINVNLIGTFNVMRLAAYRMMQQEVVNEDNERGVIINTASVAAFEGQIGQAAYSASKGGVAAMTLPVARELAKWGIRVMTIAPGIIKTPMMQAMPLDVQDNLAQSVTFPKRLGHAEEFAELAKHIIENAYLNGEVIRLDGAIRMSAK